jgi:MFS transporter, DHA1 family, multidrug resistance protein
MSNKAKKRNAKVFDPAFMCFLFMTVIICSGVSVIIPAIPNIMREFGVGARFISIAFVTLLAGRFIASLFTGILLLRFKSYQLMFVTFVLHICTMIGLMYADSGSIFAILRFFEGIFEGMVSVLLQVLVIGLSNPENRGEKMGYMQSAFGLGFIIGPVLGSIAMKFSGPSGIFGLVAGLMAVGALWLAIVYRTIKRDMQSPPRQSISFSFDFVKFLPLYSGPILQRLLVVAFAMILPLYVVDRFAFEPHQVGYFFTLSALITTSTMPITGRLSRHKYANFIVATAMVLMGLSIFGMSIAYSRPIFIAMFILETLGFAVMAPNAMKIFGDKVANHARRGEIIGTASSFRELLNILLAFFFMPIYQASAITAWLMLSGFCILLSLPYLKVPKTFKAADAELAKITAG